MNIEKTIEQPTLHKDGLTVRPVRKPDAGQITLYASDKRVAMNTSVIPHPLPPGMVESLIDRALTADREEDVWVLDNSDTQDQVLGAIMLRRLDREQSEIGFWVAPAMWNNGLASKAVDALIEANPQACKTLFASVFQDNPVSSRVLTNAGFDYIGDAETYSVARDAVVPTWTYLLKLA
ncbi:MAG: GNAT family N-acetyltransferase [Litoreibacter sp.]